MLCRVKDKIIEKSNNCTEMSVFKIICLCYLQKFERKYEQSFVVETNSKVTKLKSVRDRR
jgi:hypothetical protein